METLVRALSAAALGLAAFSTAAAQDAAAPAELLRQPSAASVLAASDSDTAAVSPALNPGVQELLAFKDSDVKFSLPDLMDILRDRRHEGWVLAAYPDPKTGRPLIGAGFSLDLPEREHPQTDPLNPHPFVEPSSAQLWQAAGLQPVSLEQILEKYHENLAVWKTKRHRRKIIRALDPEITDQEATLLLRIAAIQAIENARAYCRNFDRLTASQQMAMSQLVYQMGVNLQEFGQFLTLINDGSGTTTAAAMPAGDGERYWTDVQHSLIQSQWARLYRVRAISVIAMLDPQYGDDPDVAERRIAATLRPAVLHRHRRRAALRNATYSKRSGQGVRGKRSRLRNKRRV